MKDVIALLNCHECARLGVLTEERPLASTSFLGRYAFMDVALSNFTNSGIDNVGILVKDHQRSILKHMGNMSSWVNNTKTDKITLLTNEKGLINPPYNTDLANLKENDYLLYDSSASTLVFQSPHIIAPIDFNPIVKEHRERGEGITIVYKRIKDGDRDFVGQCRLTIDQDGYVTDASKNDGSEKEICVSLATWIIDRKALLEIVKESQRHDLSLGIADYIVYFVKSKRLKVHAYEYKGYARCFNSLEKYMEYSFELFKPEVANTLFKKDWPIFTLTHNSKPALYGPNAKISNSFIANGCIVDGDIKNSILCRGVTVEKGAKLNRCIVFRGSKIGENVVLSDVVVDKHAKIAQKHKIEGDPDVPIYVDQGASV